MPTTSEKAATFGGVAVIGGLFVGFASIFASLFGFFTLNIIAAGICLGAAGLSFGLTANAVWRN